MHRDHGTGQIVELCEKMHSRYFCFLNIKIAEKMCINPPEDNPYLIHSTLETAIAREVLVLGRS